jgi:replicative DNA helicase
MHASALSFVPQEKLPPQNLEAERAVLGSILLDPEAFCRIAGILSPGMFYSGAYGIIYEAAAALNEQRLHIDVLTLTQYLSDRNRLEKAGGQAAISNLAEAIVSAVNVDQHALLIKDKAERRSLISAGGRLAELGYDTARTLAEVVDEAESSLFRITQKTSPVGFSPTSEILTQAFLEIEQRSTTNLTPDLLHTGFYDLDEMILGLQRSDLILCGARPSMGKTSLCLGIAEYIARQYNLPVAIYSLEMSKSQLMYRLLSAIAEIESSRLRAGRIAKDEWSIVSSAIETLSRLPIYIEDTPNITATEIRSHSRRLQITTGKPLGLILIDYIQLMEGPGDNRVVELSKITRQLKGLARDLNVPVLALSQLSRGVESRPNKRPMMSDLRESGSLEQDADLIMLLYRDDYYNPDSPDRGKAELIVGKSRNSGTGTVELLFNAQYTKFKSISKSLF